MTDSQIKFYDGDYEIIFSKVFNIYENKLVINPFEGFEITFQFSEDLTKKDTSLEIKGDDINKKLLIRLTNFNNTLGIGTTNKMLISGKIFTPSTDINTLLKNYKNLFSISI